MEGKVKFYNQAKGYGFLTAEGNEKEEFFFHVSSLNDGYEPRAFDVVVFDIDQRPPRKRYEDRCRSAVNISLVQIPEWGV